MEQSGFEIFFTQGDHPAPDQGELVLLYRHWSTRIATSPCWGALALNGYKAQNDTVTNDGGFASEADQIGHLFCGAAVQLIARKSKAVLPLGRPERQMNWISAIFLAP